MRFGDLPAQHQPIGWRTAMQCAGGFAVKIRGILVRDATKLGEVEVRIHRLQWIEGPFNQIESLSERAFTLHELEAETETTAKLRQHTGHVRPLHWPALLHADHAVGEAHHAP